MSDISTSHCSGMLVDNTYHAGTVRDVAAMTAATSTGFTMTNTATNTSASSQLSVHDFVAGLSELRDELDNTNDNNIAVSSDAVWPTLTVPKACVALTHVCLY